MSNFEIRPLRWNETAAASALAAYHFPHRTAESRNRDYGRRIDPEREILVAVDDGEIVSQAHIHALGIWIDGVRFSAGGFTNVVTAPEWSRRGYASRLLRETLAYLRDELGHSLSVLYPTVYPLYNQLGWALAEGAIDYSGAPAAFRPSPFLPIDPGGRVKRRLAGDDDVELVAPLYDAFVRERSGYLDRPRWYWEDYVLRRRHGTEPRWLALWYGADRQLAGYALYAFDRGPVGSTLDVYEIIASRPEAYHALLTYLSSHHLVNQLTLQGGHDVPWGLLVADPGQLTLAGRAGQGFLLRVVDFPRAIVQRQRRSPAPGDLVLHVRDEIAPWNDGNWLIGGRDNGWICERVSGREPDASAAIGTVAALFTGYLPARQAFDVGLLQGSRAAIPALEALFNGSYPPRSNDHF